jgi:CubicO group peptidase (beta-lactamase class C family)
MNSTEPTAERELRDLLQSDAFSGVVAVEIEGRPLIEFTGGIADRRTGRHNTFQTRFATASVSKMFTAVCVARLVEAGRCRFDQPLVSIVPALQSHFDDDLSLASLLSHRSGLGDYIDDNAKLPFAGMNVAQLDCADAFLPYVLQAPRHPAGTFRYSSAGFILLGLAIEAVSGLPYPAAIAQWVLEPAGMKFTGFPALDDPLEDMAIGFLPDGSTNVDHCPRVGGPDGGIVTNVDDLRQFFHCLRDGSLIQESTWQFLSRSVSQTSGIEWDGEYSYGHGLCIVTAGGREWYGHTGSDPGVSARIAFSMDSESSIVVLCNHESVAFHVFRHVLQWLNHPTVP